MRLTRSEIRANALKFAAEWKDASDEQAEAQSFWTDLFAVFGVHRRSVASFERRVRNLGGHLNRIDVFYAGVMIGEHKARGADLAAAASQAFGYVQDLTREVQARDGKRGSTEIPRFVVVSDFARIVVYDLEAPDPLRPAADFATADLADHIDSIGFMGGFTTRRAEAEDDINIEAVELLGDLHDALERAGYRGHHLERFLVRVLFCLFADDTEIFEPDIFKEMVAESRADGSDLGPMLERWFRVLDTPRDQRARNLPEALRDLPYVNGQLFAERLEFAEFDGAMRDALLAACGFNWSRISPAVFGSLFQSIMAGAEGARQRRQIGAHYTSERDILKLIRSLFLDDLHAMLARATTGPALQRFQDHLASLKFLDPACGCGNFLVVAYREIRLLELEALKRLHARKPGQVQRVLNVQSLLKVQVDQMHGIEIEEWPARIAEVAMWLIDHQMNRLVAAEFGEPVLRLPLERGARIHLGNALRTDWNAVLPVEQCSFVMGNPPFGGKKEQDAQQKEDVRKVWGDVTGSSVLDYVTCWYRVACRYIGNRPIKAAFISTNSITQGEQPGVMWPEIFAESFRIVFGHRSFPWNSEAREPAKVHVVIVGIAPVSLESGLHIQDYDGRGEMLERSIVNAINPYLIESQCGAIRAVTKPICKAPVMRYGSMMIDKPRNAGDEAGLVFAELHKAEILDETPALEPFIRPIYGGDEYINGEVRWCLWLVEAPPALVRSSALVRRRLEGVRRFRESSDRARTRELASTPGLFGEIRQPDRRYLLVPKVSSERRDFIPIGFVAPEIIASGSALIVPDATMYDLGVMLSTMHMAWVRQVCGRLESRYQYSARLVYNNFPWPTPTDAQRAAVEATAQAILDARAQYPGQTLADLYDPVAMPKPLRDAHAANDRAVDRCYRPQPFTTERARVEFLFDLYQKLTAPLTASRISPRTTSRTSKPGAKTRRGRKG